MCQVGQCGVDLLTDLSGVGDTTLGQLLGDVGLNTTTLSGLLSDLSSVGNLTLGQLLSDVGLSSTSLTTLISDVGLGNLSLDGCSTTWV